jgi:hypothetical protein
MSNPSHEHRRSVSRTCEPPEPSANHTIDGRGSGSGLGLCSLSWHVERKHQQATPHLIGVVPLVEHLAIMRPCLVCYKSWRKTKIDVHIRLYAERGSPKFEPAARRWLVRCLTEGTPSLRDAAKSLPVS